MRLFSAELDQVRIVYSTASQHFPLLPTLPLIASSGVLILLSLRGVCDFLPFLQFAPPTVPLVIFAGLKLLHLQDLAVDQRPEISILGTLTWKTVVFHKEG